MDVTVPEVESCGSNGHFVLCVECREVHRIADADRAPLFESDGEARSSNDFAAFLTHHGVHRLSLLERTGEAELHSHPRSDPMARTVCEATDGVLTYLVTAFRPSVDAPRAYGARRGRLLLVHEAVSVDYGLLAGLVDDALYPLVAPPSRISALLSDVDAVVRAQPPEVFPVIEEDRRDPNVLLGVLPAELGPAVKRAVERSFDGAEAERVRALFEDELRSEVPVVRIERRFIARLEE